MLNFSFERRSYVLIEVRKKFWILNLLHGQICHWPFKWLQVNFSYCSKVKCERWMDTGRKFQCNQSLMSFTVVEGCPKDPWFQSMGSRYCKGHGIEVERVGEEISWHLSLLWYLRRQKAGEPGRCSHGSHALGHTTVEKMWDIAIGSGWSCVFFLFTLCISFLLLQQQITNLVT